MSKNRNTCSWQAMMQASFKSSTQQHRCKKFPETIYTTKEPELIKAYNKYMGSVDMFDKMVQMYWRKTKYANAKPCHYNNFFIHSCVHNAYIAYIHHLGLKFKEKDQLSFRMDLI